MEGNKVAAKMQIQEYYVSHVLCLDDQGMIDIILYRKTCPCPLISMVAFMKLTSLTNFSLCIIDYLMIKHY